MSESTIHERALEHLQKHDDLPTSGVEILVEFAQAERTDMREQAAKEADRFAGYMESGAGEPRPGDRLKQVARAIRDLK